MVEPRAPECPGNRNRSGAAALALALALGAGGAAAQTCNSARTVTAAAPFSTFNSNTDLTRTFANVRVETTGGFNAFAVHAYHGGNGDIDFDMKDFTLSTSGNVSGAVLAARPFRAARNTGDVELDLRCGSIVTSGSGSYGAEATNFDGGDVAAIVKKVDITTSGDNARGLHFNRAQNVGSDYATQGVKDGEVTVEIGDSTIETSGANAHAVWISQDRVVTGGGAGGIDADLTNVAISTSGAGSIGVNVSHRDTTGAVALDVTGGSVSTSGANAHAVVVDRAGTGGATITLTGVAIAAEGRGAGGVRAFHGGSGSLALTIGAGTKVEAPFAIGADARLTSDANAAGRLVVTHGGTVEARDAGVVAWAARASGHTFGDGARTADDAARTEPMLHVTSSGDVTVGDGATDAFIRAAIAGDDGMLSAGEKAVFDAIVAEDSDALTTALAALPAAAYNAAWKARATALLTSRGHAPTDAGVLANRAAEEILGLTRSGIRALALSHEAIAGHVRNGDGDGALSAAERTVLAAALTGGDLEAALAALSATYTAAWKDTLREMAASYNAGDIRVDVTGGTITAEGDGVDARYALTHDRNGAIAVTVAAGTTVSGGRHGVHVAGAGLAAEGGGLRDQTVTVNGAVMGGTGAGVHLAGGGTLMVGRSGRVGATSGVGVLSDGAGDFHATVAGTVEGDVRAEGSGEHTVTIMEGGTVTGSVLSEQGDLVATVAGTVEGDVRVQGGGGLVVVLVDPDGMGSGVLSRVQGRIVETGGTPRVLIQSSGSTQRMELLAGSPAPSGAWDVGVVQEGSDGSRLRVEREYGPRTRVYEALPSVLLGLNGLARFEERMAAARTERGGWARVEASRGEWEADSSTTGVEYTHRRSGLRAGLDVAAGEKGVLGVSAHHRLGSADVSRGGGVKLTGSGAGVSGTWLGDDAYVDVQAEVTWYEADASSMSRGTLKKEASGRGHALGVEFGRRVSMPALAEGVVFTPRAGLVHSRVSVDDFTDALGTRVTVDEARSLKGRVGVLLEAEPGGSPNRVSGSLDVEHEFSGDMKVRVSGVEMTPEAEATWVRVGLNGSHAWDDGRYTLRGGVSYARSGESYEVGGGVSLEVRF